MLTLTRETETLPLSDLQLTLSTSDVCPTHGRVNARKAAGLEGIPGWVLEACTKQLVQVFQSVLSPSSGSHLLQDSDHCSFAKTCHEPQQLLSCHLHPHHQQVLQNVDPFPSEILPVLNTGSVCVHLLPQQTNRGCHHHGTPLCPATWIAATPNWDAIHQFHLGL